MPRYFFALYGPDDEIISDPTGTILADKFQAIAHAKRIVRELKDGGGYDAGWALVVTDDDGDEVASLPF